LADALPPEGEAATRTISSREIKVADEVWLAVALLHREHPERIDFSTDEVMERAAREGNNEPLRPGVYVHVLQHCVANRPPNPGRYRMLFETAPGRRRLFCTGDAYDHAREGSKIVPEQGELPQQYRYLLDWYREWNAVAARKRLEDDPLLALRGSGKHLWADEHADQYVRRLREGWQ
jgi:hypothetical protein